MTTDSAAPTATLSRSRKIRVAVTLTLGSQTVAMLCPTPRMAGQFTSQIGTASVSKAKVAPDGTFVGVATAKDASIRIRRKLRAKKLSGGVAELSVRTCSGTAEFTAKG